jgi:Fe2+ transport system protein B
MGTSYQKILNQIIELKVKDTLPDNSTAQDLEEYQERIHMEVNSDYSSIPIDKFNEKYEKYLGAAKKKATSAYKKQKTAPKKVEKSVEELEKEQEEKRMQTLKEMQEKYPPNTRFFSCTNKDEEKWHRYETMPSDEMLEKKKAIPWTAGMMGAAASYLGSFVVVAVHKDYRVIEFEYLYQNDKLYNPSF